MHMLRALAHHLCITSIAGVPNWDNLTSVGYPPPLSTFWFWLNKLKYLLTFLSFRHIADIRHCLHLCLCSGPDETEWPRSGHSIDPPAMEPESVRRWCPAFLVTMETAMDDTNGHLVGLGAPSRAMEALRHLSLPYTEELCVTVSFCSWECTVIYSHCN